MGKPTKESEWSDELESVSKDDDEESVGTETQRSSHDMSSSRDEEEEVRKQSQKETAKVQTWRILVFLALLATAISVTATTYALLVRQEDENFRNVFSQFARTVADAAIDQQKDLRTALKGLSNTMSLTADTMNNGNPPWPFLFPPMFEVYAQDYFKVSKAEFVGISTIVTREQREDWVNFSTANYQQVIQDAHYIRFGNLNKLDNNTKKYKQFISKKTPDGFVPNDERDLYFVRSVQSPPPRKYSLVNWDLTSNPQINASMRSAMRLRNETVVSNIRPFLGLADEEHQGFHSDENADNPHCFAFHPVFQYAGDLNSKVVAMISTATAFDASMRNLLPSNVKGMLCVIQNTCNQTFSYMIEGKEAYYQGFEDNHDPSYDDMALQVPLTVIAHPEVVNTPGNCMYSMKIYPTKEFENDYKTSTPLIFAAVVAGTFVAVALVFFTYDYFVLKRNEIMISNAAQSSAIVSSIVPDHLKDRLLSHQQQINEQNKQNKASGGSRRSSSGSLKMFLNDGSKQLGMDNSAVEAPLADLFLETTVLFADISGFTAWSSVREPTQVFVLLETLFQSFDRIAKKRRVFKVETVGDCYVAVCGLPDPRREHAVVMARFAQDILSKFYTLTRKLEVTLGPDTADLSLRIGIHSGPVTAGVLRGERARFQLFGDTMNTCARLESSSKPNRIQCSKATAEQIIKSGKGAWLQPRSDPIALKGLGSIEGFWVNVSGERAGSVASCRSSQGYGSPIERPGLFPELDKRTVRLIDWNVEMLSRIMMDIAAKRASVSASTTKKQGAVAAEFGDAPLEEVREIITLPEFDHHASLQNPEDQKIPVEVVEELRLLVSHIASMYNDNPFHNFNHASHVVMSVIKLMARIVAPSHFEDLINESQQATASSLHDHTYGITSDPLTQFACAFSALIHDVDHVGVSNAQLVKEGVPIAIKYKERSVAEQNSLNLSWDLLMQPTYSALRDFLFETQADLIRFRQLVVNSVMSTDIVDTELKKLRNDRWDKAFKKGDSATAVDENPRDEVNRKATIVIEHIIQASDISHTMQHWHVYRRWNQNLFEELYVAYLNGRMEKDPATFWYNGEIGFFDFYIIPITKKLKECGVFGVSSDEYLNYALKNREEWFKKGEDAVALMVEEVKEKYGVKGAPNTDCTTSTGTMPSISESAPMEQALPAEKMENEVDC
ncbi:Receptor-type guanylate cyclase gcy [Seminavis robusta]|uniref:Receptor-type guanylate cyclase gcy n=1 Tax=Seminavis robusta TaxID=568900 RepID=A0A9N8EMP1_9STRA|nr:Receptor-type guanylate cyclase gcy [Seminavis robusta]|eukprot:Sro1240_g255340.1 Receptor-type guanylate cyclase gcy (1181) ;mRNA; f:17335-22505